MRRRVSALLIFFSIFGFFTAVAVPTVAAIWPEQHWFERLSVEKAWQISRGSGVVVAVIDTGVVDTPAALRGQVLPGVDFSGTGGDGRSDAGQSAAPGYTYSHGTNMAALIAGRSDVDSLVGIAPDAKILPIKVFTRTGEGGNNDDLVAKGIRYAVDHKADIINLSLAGGNGTCGADVASAVKYAYTSGVIVVAGAGNQSGPVLSPANCPGALAISAIDKNFVPWSKTATGPAIDFTSIAVDMPQLTTEGGKLMSEGGTSDAAAITSGIFALLKSHFPDESARQLVARVIATAKTGTGKSGRANDSIGYGQPLPYQALTVSLPADAANPIYDTFDAKLGVDKTTADTKSDKADKPSSTDKTSFTIPIILSVIAGLGVIGLVIAVLVLRRKVRKTNR